MSAADSIVRETRGILKRGLQYILTTVIGTTGMFLGVSFLGLPVLIIAKFVITPVSHLGYFSFLTIFGLSLFASQLMAHDQWSSDTTETELSDTEKIIVAASYYNLLIITGAILATVLVALELPLAATAVALLAGPIDIELARRVNMSPLTTIVGVIFAIAYLLDWLRQPSTGTPQPRDIAGISTLERIRRRGNDRIFG